MNKFGKYFFMGTLLILLLWLIPWTYRFVTAESVKHPFMLYSGQIGDFAVLDNSGGDAVYTDLSGNVYTEAQFDSILPLFYYRQLMAEERLPDTLHGVAISPRAIQMGNFIFRTTPMTVNAHTVPLYPLLESMSGRVDLEMPDDVFRMSHRMEFIDMVTNRVKEEKSRLFTDMLLKKGFVFPARLVAGNPTTRKEYDEGYLMVDGSGKLFHVKQLKSRPYVRPIKVPQGMDIQHLFLTEFKDRKSLAFLTDSENRFWVLRTKTYEFHQVKIPPFDPKTMSLSIIGNMFDWTVILNDGGKESLHAINADSGESLASYERPVPKLSLARRIGKYVFPVRIEFSSAITPDVFPALKVGE